MRDCNSASRAAVAAGVRALTRQNRPASTIADSSTPAAALARRPGQHAHQRQQAAGINACSSAEHGTGQPLRRRWQPVQPGLESAHRDEPGQRGRQHAARQQRKSQQPVQRIRGAEHGADASNRLHKQDHPQHDTHVAGIDRLARGVKDEATTSASDGVNPPCSVESSKFCEGVAGFIGKNKGCRSVVQVDFQATRRADKITSISLAPVKAFTPWR